MMAKFLLAFITFAIELFRELNKRPPVERDNAIRELQQGMRLASETKDTSQLEAAIRKHCGPDGCRVPD